MRKLTFFTFLFLLPIISYCQSKNPGYLGKRFIAKLNLINGIRPLYIGGEIEYTVHRNVSIGIGAGYLTSDYKQTYFKQHFYTDPGSAVPGINDYYYYRRETTSPLTKMNSTSFYLQCKYYPFNKVNPAPDGLYFAVKLGLGFTDIVSQSGYQLDNPMGAPAPSGFSVKGILFDFYELGFGYQKILAKRFVIDATACFNLTNLDPGGTTSKMYTSTLVPDFGPNTLYPFPSTYAPKGAGEKYGGFNSYEVEKYSPINYSWNGGLSIYLKVGFLLF